MFLNSCLDLKIKTASDGSVRSDELVQFTKRTGSKERFFPELDITVSFVSRIASP